MKINGVHHLFTFLLIVISVVATHSYDTAASEASLRVEDEDSGLMASYSLRQLSAKCPFPQFKKKKGCVCPKNFVQKGKKCKCINGFVLRGPSTCQCPKGKVVKKGSCVCPYKNQQFLGGKCTCIGGQYLNRAAGSCLCPIAFPFFDGFQCLKVAPLPVASPSMG